MSLGSDARTLFIKSKKLDAANKSKETVQQKKQKDNKK
jgi:hypothetical protein